MGRVSGTVIGRRSDTSDFVDEATGQTILERYPGMDPETGELPMTDAEKERARLVQEALKQAERMNKPWKFKKR